ncbi:DUF1217 domain-containing protein [Mesorhizobium sp. BAC0120]|uniref:DUF1217 domain-containing protein n=1 Tax=Mesorhizobium sp. BAC0120 TaxID=3090670 RepID=UPI00298D2667|nr:DUF1217 domain-containing protein [Mesorhizobium sp. BAC0120]MDW6024450.1 DUF1217 domain-containing protein [Mesorhizobium sp. BAC0120]
MLDTYTSYQLIMRDLPKALGRVEKQPVVDRETAYYLENITKVKSVDDFVNNYRLFSYAMKAFGLQDMTYAKAFMVKAMKGGVSDPNSFANKLTDKRYAEFVKTYNFAANGEQTTSYVKAQQEVTANYATQATIAGVDPNSEAVKTETNYYLANIVKVKSIDDFLKNDRLVAYALKAYGINPANETKDHVRQLLEGGLSDPNSPANKSGDVRYKAFVSAFNFQELGENTTTYNPVQKVAVDKYVRQTLEENAGQQNQGVQLALYFERNAPGIKSFYSMLSDKALRQVLYTALGVPDSFATADIDHQVAYFKKKLDIADLQDPEKLGKFLTRFTALWEIKNPSTPTQASASVLFARPTEAGISTNLLLTLQNMKR